MNLTNDVVFTRVVYVCIKKKKTNVPVLVTIDRKKLIVLNHVTLLWSYQKFPKTQMDFQTVKIN